MTWQPIWVFHVREDVGGGGPMQNSGCGCLLIYIGLTIATLFVAGFIKAVIDCF